MGFVTWIKVLTGYKIWVFSRVPALDKCKDRQSFLNRMDDYKGNSVEFAEKSEKWFIVAGPGDLMYVFRCIARFANTECFHSSIQPPGQPHEVYTAQESVSTGGHAYTYGTLGRSESNLFYDRETEHKDTNFAHPSAQLTLTLMLNAIKQRPQTRKSCYCSR